MIKVKMTSKLWNYVKEHEGYIFNLWPKELRDEMNEIICYETRDAIETFWSNGRDYESGWWGGPEHYRYCIGCEAYRFSPTVEPDFTDTSIKYVVGIYLTNLSDAYKKSLSNFKVFDTPYGDVLLVSSENEDYTTINMPNYVWIFSTRAKARTARLSAPLETIFKVAVDANDNIVEWIKKNP